MYEIGLNTPLYNAYHVGAAFFTESDKEMDNVKRPTTFEEQINILKSRDLRIESDERAINILSSVNYYNFTGYLYTYKDRSGMYNGITFDKAYRIYLCDKRIKSIILYAVELVEHNLKTKIAYLLGHELGALCYINPSNFTNANEHARLMEKFNKAVKNNKNLLFVKHHNQKYGGKFPIWVAIELFTLGMVWNCYKYLQTPIKKKIAHKFNIGAIYLESWIECISYLRNMTAHYMRLYRTSMQKTPKQSKIHNNVVATNRIFDTVLVMKFLSPDNSEWNDYVIPSLSQIFNEYSDVITLSDYGFPDNWQHILHK